MQRCKVGVEPNAALRVGGEGETSDSLTPSPAQAGLFSEFLPREAPLSLILAEPPPPPSGMPAAAGVRGNAQVLASREEALLKRQQDAVNEPAHLMERYANRLSFQSLNFAEGYLDGRLNIGLKLRAWGSDHEFPLVVARHDIGFKQNVWLAVPDNEGGRAYIIARDQVAFLRHQSVPVLKSQPDYVTTEHAQRLPEVASVDTEWRDGNPVFFVPVEKMEGAKVCVPS